MKKRHACLNEKRRRNETMDTEQIGELEQTSSSQTGTAWVRDVLEPEQLSTAKQSFGRRKLSPATVLLMWALRIYVILMVLLIAFQVWNALHL
jgi:hypothetical protein